MATDTYTVNNRLIKPYFDKPRYQDDINGNMDIIDALLAKYIAVNNVRGVWLNSTIYAAEDAVVDPDDGQLYKALMDNTSPGAPTTFLEYRTNNPGVWSNLTIAVRFRGVWVTGTDYSVGDFVVYQNIYAVCITPHSAGPTFAGDASFWSYLINFDASDKQQTATVNGGSTAISWVNGSHAIVTVTANSTITFTAQTLTSSTQSLRLTVLFSGNYTLTVPTSRWPNGVAPTISQGAGGSRQEYVFTTSDNGSSFDAFATGMNMS